MAPTSRSNTGNGFRSKPTLEIIPDTRFIVFHGGEHEASAVKLKGVVRLTAPEPMSILKPKVRLEGKRKISWFYMGGVSAGEVVDKRSFWNQEQKLGIESAHKIKAGTIEWPFEFELSPSMPESVEGLRETYIAYHLHASVSRPGWNAKDLLAQEHLRIVRTLGQDSMEMTRSRVNSDIWANKISYSISIPSDAIVFGTSITADVELSPIKKGLRLGKVELRLQETVVKRIQTTEVPDSRDRTKSEETEVAKEDMEFPENSRVMYDEETPDDPMMGDEMYKFKATLPLPKSLNHCRQDVDSHQINVTHRFKLMVNLHNPEGHVSQLVCRLPVKIFISPNLPVDESNQVCPTANGISHETLNNAEVTITAPPQYGLHQLDQIFSDMDPTHFMSRAPSNPASPSGVNAQSRSGSQEDLASLNVMTNGIADGETSDDLAGASPAMLRSRLADLQQRDALPNGGTQSVTFSDHPSYDNSPGPGMPLSREQSPENLQRPNRMGSNFNSSRRNSPRASAPTSRRTSEEDESTEVQQTDYDMASLARVPSYGAALRTPGTLTPFTEGPPSYVEATSRPPTPPSLQRPSQAHIRRAVDSPNSASSQQTSTNNLSNLSMTPGQAGVVAQPSRSHRGSTAGEDEARIRMLRART